MSARHRLEKTCRAGRERRETKKVSHSDSKWLYFRLRINGREIPHRIFGRPLTWSDDSSLCAAQEWLTTDYAAGPVTRAVLIKVASWEMATLPVVGKGFAESFQFDELRFHYRKLYSRFD